MATPFSLDSLRNRYSLSIDKLNEYRIQDVELEFQIPEDKASRVYVSVLNTRDHKLLLYWGKC